MQSKKHLGKPESDPLEFNALVQEKVSELNIPEELLDRELNYGFSGGEKSETKSCNWLYLIRRLLF